VTSDEAKAAAALGDNDQIQTVSEKSSSAAEFTQSGESNCSPESKSPCLSKGRNMKTNGFDLNLAPSLCQQIREPMETLSFWTGKSDNSVFLGGKPRVFKMAMTIVKFKH
jgi:hypothetical protein